MHRADPAKFDEFVGKAPVLTSAQRTATAKDPANGAAALGDAELAVMRQMGLSAEDMQKSKASMEARV
jgi:phage I-like protein